MSITALVYLLIFSVGIIKAFTSRPVFGLYAYFFCFYLHAPARWWGRDLPSLRWSFLAAIATMIAIFVHRKKFDKIYVLDFKENKIFLCFVMYVFLQAFWALNLKLQIDYMVLAFKFLILIFILQNAIRSKEDMIGVIIINTIGCSYFTYLGIASGGSGRMENLGSAGLESANQLGQHIAAVFMFSCYLLLHDFGKKKYLLLPLILMTLNGLMMTQSRGAILGVVGGGLVALFFIPKTTKKIFLIYTCLGALAVSVLVGPAVIDRFKSMVPDDGQEQDKSAESRFVIIDAQLDMFAEKPIHGWGHKGTLLLSPSYLPDTYLTNSGDDEKGKVRASHNLIMALLVDHGLIGLMLYLGVVGTCCMKLFKLKRFSLSKPDSILYSILLTGFVIALISFIVSGMGSNNKKLELDIWIFAIVPLLFHWLTQLDEAEVKEVKDSKVEAVKTDI